MTLEVTVYDGKYTVILDDKGALKALRYGEEWRDCCGDGLILALAQEVERLRESTGKPTPEEINNAGVAWLAEHKNCSVPHSMTSDYWSTLISTLNSWGFTIVKK